LIQQRILKTVELERQIGQPLGCATGIKAKGWFMRERVLTIPEIVLIAGTRVALGAGLGLLIGEKLSRDARKGAGWALLAVGALSSIPIVISVLGKPRLVEDKAA
jgi:hypothetical protein